MTVPVFNSREGYGLASYKKILKFLAFCIRICARRLLIMKILNYRILLREEDEGGYTVLVPSLPGCVTYGDTMDEAVTMAKEAIELYLESLLQHGEPILTEQRMFEYNLAIEAHV
jgi:antitoxin HicB